MTPELKAELYRLKEQSGVGETLLFRESKNIPKDLTLTTVLRFMRGEQKSLTAKQLEWLLAAWKNVMPRIELTPEIKEKMDAERARTKAGLTALIKYAPDIPDGLSASSVTQFLLRYQKTIRKDYLDFVLKAYAALPDAHPDTKVVRMLREGYVTITDEIRAELLALRKETGFGPARLLRGSKNRPDKLDSGIIKPWLSGASKTANEVFLTYVLTLWRERLSAMKNKCASEMKFTLITPEIQTRLRQFRKRMGISPAKLLKGRLDCPDGLLAKDIGLWMSQQRSKRVPSDHLDYVTALYEQTACLVRYSRIAYAELLRELKRTGATVSNIAQRIERCPEDFDFKTLKVLLNRSKSYVRQDHLDFLITFLKALPDRNIQDKKPYLRVGEMGNLIEPEKKVYVGVLSKDLRPITQKERDEIKHQMQRTGVGIVLLLNKFSQTKPDKLYASTVTQWLNGRVKRTSPDRMKWVLEQWRSLLDKAN